MTGELSKNFHGVGIGPLSKILAVNDNGIKIITRPLPNHIQISDMYIYILYVIFMQIAQIDVEL